MGLLPVENDLVAEIADILLRKLRVLYLGFLQTDEFGCVLVDHALQLMQALAQAVDVKRDYLHRGCRSCQAGE